MRIIFLTGLLACSFFLSVAQPSIKTTVDKAEILIGDQFQLTIEAGSLPEAYKINWPTIPDSLAHFEVVKRGAIDTLYRDNRLTGMVQTFTLTSFDSGKWLLPSYLIKMVPEKNDTIYDFFTDSVAVIVSFSTADTTSQLRDIKPIREVETIHPAWYWIVAGALLAALVIFFVWFYRKGKKNKVDGPFHTKTTPYEEAINELDKLTAFNLSGPDEIKLVHVKIGEILKRYLSRTQHADFLNKTTGDILILLSDYNLEKDMLAKSAASLRCGDAVKFAKYLPPAAESKTSIQSIREIIILIHQHTQNAQPKTINLKP